MSAVSSAITTLSLTEQAASLYIDRMNTLHSIGELLCLSITFGLVFTGGCYFAKFLVFIGKFIYKFIKERGVSND